MTAKFNYLYVEDDALSREVMETLMHEVIGVGSLTTFADSADFASRLAALEPKPDFILLDIHVPPHDGYAMLTMIRDNPDLRSAEVLAVTASVMAQEIEHLKARGFNGALAKPLDMMTFPEIIRRLEAGETIWQTR